MTVDARPERALSDEEARRRIREDLDATLFVEAAAGTGKTTALVSRIIALLRSGRATLPQIVAVTFTEKAAGEMKLRVRTEIEKARIDPSTQADERNRLDAALGHLELARIGTIHAFCGALLRERPVEARIDPLFEVVDEAAASRLLESAFDVWFERALADPPEGVRRVLRRRPRRGNDEGPREMLRRAVGSLVEHRDFDASWRRDPFDRNDSIDRLLERLADAAAFAERADRSDDWLAKSFLEIARFLDENRLREAVRGRDYDGLEAELRDFARSSNRHWRWTGGKRRYGRALTRDEALGVRNDVKRELDTLLEACDADLSPLLRDELRPVVEAYETAKARAGTLDFLDLLLRARDLVRDDEQVRREFQERFTHFFVDEFQDTDPLQADLLLLLAADDPEETGWRKVNPVPGKLFVVGDPKQSIYRFRRADVALYQQVKRQLLGKGAEVLQLTASFRGLPCIQAVVNAAFAPVMQGSTDGSQAEYVPLEAVRSDAEERPSVVVLPVPRPYGDYGSIVKWKIEESFPDAVGAFVAWLVHESNWTVEESGRPGLRVKVEARHVCVLLRRFQSWTNDMTRPYVRALEARGVPHVLLGGRSFHDREEVLAIRNALTAIEWPADELRVFATLRGPFFAFGDDVLLAFRHAHSSLHPLRWLDAEMREALEGANREIADALGALGQFHQARNHRPIAQTISQLLEATRAHAGIAIWPTGEQALANCLRTIDLARRFERGGAPSFRAFVDFLEEEAEGSRSEDAPVVEEGTEGVRIMTVHRAKGLEFPVVILADPTCNATGANPSRHVDPDVRLWAEPLCDSVPPDLRDAEADERRRDIDESVRLAYVATTRARDLLVVPGLGDLDANDEMALGWLQVLNPVIYPAKEARRASERVPGCPDFGNDTVRERPESCPFGPGRSVQPGLHRGSGAPVVWWDPMKLVLDVQEQVGLRQERILAADNGEIVATEGIEAHARWQTRREQTLKAGSTPMMRVAVVTALAAAGRTPARQPEIRVEEVALDRTTRPGGRRFGLLVHATLAAVELAADAEDVRIVTRAQGRLFGSSDEEVKAAAAAVSATLAHPLLQRAADAAQSGELRRETPVLVRIEDGSLAEGVIDLGFREVGVGGPQWTIIDFKTDRELGDSQSRYRTQVGLYAEAVAKATGEGAHGVILVV
jgi:ATP-dependent exoDNAse (exonuclease V) beta subunit